MSTEKEHYETVLSSFNKQLKDAVKAKGGIELQTLHGDLITDIKLCDTVGLYGIPKGDDTPIEFESIVQSLESGEVEVITKNEGMMPLSDFEKIGAYNMNMEMIK
jgi:hypothetical protein